MNQGRVKQDNFCAYCGSDKDVIFCPIAKKPFCYFCCRYTFCLVCDGEKVCERYRKIFKELLEDTDVSTS